MVVAVPYPSKPGVVGHARWGPQLDLRAIGGDGRVVPGVVAAYLAKYATKSTDAAALLDHRLHEADLDGLESPGTPHLALMARTAWDRGARTELEDLRLRAWSHTLGFGGHWLTKSRAYSTTFSALRAARSEWHRTRQAGNITPVATDTVSNWEFFGRGSTTPGDAGLAATAARQTAEERRTAREERRTTVSAVTPPQTGEADGQG